ncbi:MAG: sigma-70 family RNA polymerase sigma factor [Pirellulales bacterium]
MALPTETRATLLLRIRDPKNTEAWREFITIYEPLIAGVAGRLGLQSADADELVQEVFLVVLEKQHLYKPSGESASFRRWLGTVARNAAITRLRKKANACSAIGGTDSIRKLDLAVDPLSPADEFDRLYEMEERRHLLDWATEQVRARSDRTTWDAFWKTAVEGQDANAVALLLNISVGQVYVAKCRTLKRLRETVEQFTSQ